MRYKLFVAYYQDIHTDNVIAFLKEEFKIKAPEIELVAISNPYKEKNYHQLWDIIDDCFGSLILFTPIYRSCIEQKTGFIFTEYETIFEIAKRRYNSFSIFPVQISNIYHDGLTQVNQNNQYYDLTQLHFKDNEVTKNEKFSEIEKTTSRLIKDVTGFAPVSEKKYTAEQKYLLKTLFQEPKAHFNSPENEKLISSIIIRNKTLYGVSQNEVSIIKGRKGSGKSTLTQVIPFIYNDIFLSYIPISANELDLDNVYTRILNESDLSIATKYKVKRRIIFTLGWKYFIHLMMLDLFVNLPLERDIQLLEENEIKEIKDYFNNLPSSYTNYLYSEIQDKKQRYTALCKVYFPHAMSQVVNFIEKINTQVKTSEASKTFDWTNQFNENNFLNFCLPDKILAIINRVIPTIKDQNTRILFTLDDFDTPFYEGRKWLLHGHHDESNDFVNKTIKQRSALDVDLLYSLLQIILDPNVRNSKKSVFSILHFCITIPEDLYLDIEKQSRDSYVLINHVKNLSWTGIELMSLMRRRLEYYLNKNILTKKENGEPKAAYEMLEELTGKYIKELPKSINVNFKGKSYEVPFFIYIIRHTFWRPREIIFHYYRILSAINAAQNENFTVDEKYIKAIVKNNSRSMIEHEFLTEFDTHCFNFKSILGLFKGKHQVLTYSELKSIVSTIEFKIISSNVDHVGADIFLEKLTFLYQIGFLGLVLDPEKAESENAHKYSFIFNSGANILKNRLKEESDYINYTFIIHPIFCEYLGLITDRNEEFVLNFSYEYLFEQFKNDNLLEG